jgi:2-methylcitrate dehydratase PrpD
LSLIDEIINLSEMQVNQISPKALKLAQYSLLDWLVCGFAGIQEPLAKKMRTIAKNEAGIEVASLFGGRKVPARMAALVNGATSHALDYDDTHFGHIGHLSVAIYPAALAVAEESGKSAKDVVDAFVIGAEAAIRIGLGLGSGHYNNGYHQTATAGAFGATVAAGRLYGLTKQQMRHALGLCSTRASGLKSQFGTMGKPYNAGIAAINGVECAQLAALDFTSTDDGLMGAQGFFATHRFDLKAELVQQTNPSQKFLFEDNKYKLHACCHGLHAMIEALQSSDARDLTLDDIGSVLVLTHSKWLLICDNKKPRTGLEVKFSYAWLAGMALRSDDTGNDRNYTDSLVSDPQLVKFAKNVRVVASQELTDMQVFVHLVLKNGQEIHLSHDLSIAVPLEILHQNLQKKATSVIGEKGKLVWGLLEKLDSLSAKDIGEIIVT